MTLDLDDAEAVGSQTATSAHVRTRDYDSREQRVAIGMETSNGAITLTSG